MRALAPCAAIAVCLALPAATTAGTADYGGKIEKGGKIGIDTNGGTTVVDQMRFKKVPARCNGQGGFIVGASFNFNPDLTVTNNEFSIDATDPDGTKLLFNGRFKDGGQKITGEVKATLKFNGGALTCRTRKRDYRATLGGNGPNPRVVAPALGAR